jgi:hypothetical protein
MKQTRKKHGAASKAKVALAAIFSPQAGGPGTRPYGLIAYDGVKSMPVPPRLCDATTVLLETWSIK